MQSNQTIPVQQTSPLPAKVKIPPTSKPPKPKDNPKEPFKGKKIWAERVDGEWLMEHIAQRLTVAIYEELIAIEDELSGENSVEPETMPAKALCVEPEAKKTALSYRHRILKRAGLL